VSTSSILFSCMGNISCFLCDFCHEICRVFELLELCISQFLELNFCRIYLFLSFFHFFLCMKKVHDDDLTLFSSSSSSSFCFFLSLVCGSFVGCDLFVFWPNGCESKGPIHTSHWLPSLSLKLGFEPILSFSSLSTY
jgi:hypothetical protein